MILPVRIAHNRHAALSAFNDAYFTFLKHTGCTALYLQDSPFEPMRTGNAGQFYSHFHLISFFDIARAHNRSMFQEYINEICRRAERHQIVVWLDCWEPRLPAYARAMTSPDWRGRGGWGWLGDHRIAFCWEHPDAVAYWKAMARDALAALPLLEGVIVSMIDNEASFCDATCPRCAGRSGHDGALDVFRTFKALAAQRQRPLRIAMYDWWMPTALKDQIMQELPEDSLVIGRSTRGLPKSAPDDSWHGFVSDISNVVDGNAPDFAVHCSKARANALTPIDMVAWSRGMENFFLPAPPDPLFAIRKYKSLVNDRAEGWMDYDCGNLEPGSISEALRACNEQPAADEDTLLEHVLKSVWGDGCHAARLAYDAYREARRWLPTDFNDISVVDFSARGCGFGFCLFAPWQLDDLRFHDTGHAFNYFAPYNLLTEETIPLLRRSTRECAARLGEAWRIIQSLAPDNEPGRRDYAAFEIHWRNALSMQGYIELAHLKLTHLRGHLADTPYQEALRRLAMEEIENLEAVEQWVTANPGALGNPCHRIAGHLDEAWPDADFSSRLFAPKFRSLTYLRDAFTPKEWVPGYLIQQTPDPGPIF